MTVRKSELAQMCAVEVRKTSAITKSLLADYGYHLVESVIDSEMSRMIHRLSGKPVTETDMPILRELVIADIWPRLRAAHRERRKVGFGRLASENNDIIVSDADFAFDVGWLPLVRDAVERMRTYPKSWKARLDGGKEKFGCLVLHVDCDYGQRGCRSEIERLREETRLRSLATCDICGEQGRLRLGSYAKTVCDRHSAIFEGFRDDDGAYADPWGWHEEQPVMDHIDDIVTKARAVMDAAKDADSVSDPLRETDIGKRIDDDTWSKRGREQELLLEFAGVIQDAVTGAVVIEEYLDDYIAKELDGWSTTAAVPVSDRDRAFLHGYLRELIREEYGRVKGK